MYLRLLVCIPANGMFGNVGQNMRRLDNWHIYSTEIPLTYQKENQEYFVLPEQKHIAVHDSDLYSSVALTSYHVVHFQSYPEHTP
ncbi:MAG: hypothetical protein WC052_04830 [Patescibacteria group bacterium]|jgi:hypothetical protein